MTTPSPPPAQTLTLPLTGARGLLLPDAGPGRRREHSPDRRLKVAAYTMQGYSVRKIARLLGCSPFTVIADRRAFSYALEKGIEDCGIDVPRKASSEGG